MSDTQRHPLICSICGKKYAKASEARFCERSSHAGEAPVPQPVFMDGVAPVTALAGVTPVPKTVDSDEVADLKATIKILVRQLAEAQASK